MTPTPDDADLSRIVWGADNSVGDRIAPQAVAEQGNGAKATAELTEEIWEESRAEPRGPTPAAVVGPLEAGTIWGLEKGPESSPPVQIPIATGDRRSAARRTSARLSHVARRRVRRLAVALTVLGALALVGDFVYIFPKLSSALGGTGLSFKAARAHLAEGDLDQAREKLRNAQDDLERASDLFDHPAAMIATLSPDGRVVRSLIEQGLSVVPAMSEALAVSEQLGLQQDGIGGSLLDDGAVNLDAFETVHPSLQRGQQSVGDALQAIERLPRPWRSDVAAGLLDARQELTAIKSTLDGAVRLSGTLPGMLGDAGPRRYLLVFTAPGEARATGGLFGLYGVLHAEEGRIRLGRIGPTSDLQQDRPVTDGPEWFLSTYRNYKALEDPRQTNVSPNFPAVAQVWLEMYEERFDRSLDGALTMDPIVLSQLLPATGRLRVEGERIDADNVGEILMVDSYTKIESPEKQERFLAAVVDAFWRRLRGGSIDSPQFAEGFGKAVGSGHLKVYSQDESEQEELHALGATGSPPDNSQLIFHNSYGVNKVDYFLDRDIATAVDLNPDGTADVETTVTLQNFAPDSPPSLLLGPPPGSEQPGLNRMAFSVLAPEGAARLRFETAEHGTYTPFIYEEESRKIAQDFVEIPPAGRIEVVVRYRVDAPPSAGPSDFAMSFVPHPLVNVDDFSLTVSAPRGYEVVFEGTDHLATSLTETLTVTAQLRATGGGNDLSVGPDGPRPLI